MVALPSPVLEYLSSTLLTPRSPAYLRVDKDGCLSGWGGPLSTYGLVDLQQGKPVEDQILFLSGFFPLENAPIYLPCMKTEAGYPVDIHLVSGTGEDWVLLLDATQEEHRQRLLQQKTNDLALLRQQQAPLQPGTVPTDANGYPANGHTPNEPADSENEAQNEAGDGLAELRQILIGPEQSQLLALQEQLKNLNIDAAALSRVLPEAIVLRTRHTGQNGQAGQDTQLAKALTPTIEASLQASVKKDPKPLIDAIFPVLGPAIRKATAQALEGLLQSVNTALDHSFSLKSLRWRVEAWRTGRPFAEVVLSHTLLYRVEQVFLIHRDSGLPLLHASVGPESEQSEQSEYGADMVSGMLTAIQDFARDSFHISAEEGLESFHVGELSVWIEPGPYAIIAGVIRGNAPHELHAVFQDAIETIHLKQRDILASFNGETTPFEACRPQLEACLQLQHQEASRTRPSVLLWLLLGAAVIGLGAWLFGVFQERGRWTAYIDRLHAEPGIVVTTAHQREGKYLVAGLRDPLAADPDQLLRETGLEPHRVINQWEPYQTLLPAFILKRAQQILSPPSSVSLTFDEGQLVATGSAPHQWIATATTVAPAIAGVTHFQTDALVDTDLKTLQMRKTQIERTMLRFVSDSVQFTPDHEIALRLLTSRLRSLLLHAGRSGSWVQIMIIGSADSTGAETANRRLSQARADQVRSLLVAAGIPAPFLHAAGKGIQVIRATEKTEPDKALNRSVSFQVLLLDAQLFEGETQDASTP